MMRIVMLFIAMMIGLGSCNGQTKKKETKPNPNAPKTDIKVNKEYDKNGNLIKYDSTYSSYYSNVQHNSMLKDSIFEKFKNQFNQRYFFSEEPFFNDLFFKDSLLRYDFYKKDFFTNRFRFNMERMDKLFWEMDSLKNKFYMDQFQQKMEKFSPGTQKKK